MHGRRVDPGRRAGTVRPASAAAGSSTTDSERALRQLDQGRARLAGPQQGLGCEHDQRLVPGAARLGAQEVEVLGGRRRLGQAHVVPGAQGQEPLDPGRGVLGALALVAVGEQQDQA